MSRVDAPVQSSHRVRAVWGRDGTAHRQGLLLASPDPDVPVSPLRPQFPRHLCGKGDPGGETRERDPSTLSRNRSVSFYPQRPTKDLRRPARAPRTGRGRDRYLPVVVGRHVAGNGTHGAPVLVNIHNPSSSVHGGKTVPTLSVSS